MTSALFVFSHAYSKTITKQTDHGSMGTVLPDVSDMSRPLY